MARAVLLSTVGATVAEVLPSLEVLSHEVTSARDVADLVDVPFGTCVLVDARTDLPGARTSCLHLAELLPDLPVVLVVTEGGFAAVTTQWSVADVVLTGAGPAEVDARLRLAAGRRPATEPEPATPDREEDLVIDASGYSARLQGRPLDLAYKEFELLKFLVASPGRVFTRAQILEEVWGFDYYGGTRTVDVHVRRLRAKLGPEHEGLIGTVRNVGYRYDAPWET